MTLRVYSQSELLWKDTCSQQYWVIRLDHEYCVPVYFARRTLEGGREGRKLV
jgi:hypothetical protein